MKFLQEMAHSIGMEASRVDDSSLPIESRTSADYNPSKSMKEEKQHNLCNNLHSQVQTRGEEIKCLVGKISALTEKMSMILLRQQAYNDRNRAFSATHSQKLDAELQVSQEAQQELADTKKKLKTVETQLADANKKNLQLEAKIKNADKARQDLEKEIALFRSRLDSGSKS